eukprot:UN26242
MKWIGLANNEGVIVSALIYKVFKRRKVIYLNQLATHPDHRENGYATRLLNFFVKQSRQNGSKKEILFYCDEERVPFYQRRGAVLLKEKV